MLIGLGAFAHVSQKGGGVVNGGHPDAAPLHPGAVLAGDAEIGIDKPLGGDAAEADDDLRLHQCHLIAQILDAGVLLRFQGIPVPGRTAFDNVGNVAVGVSIQVDDGQHIVQQFARRANEGNTRQILLLAGAFAHKHHIRFPVAHAENHIVPGLAQAAPVTAASAGFQFIPVSFV